MDRAQLINKIIEYAPKIIAAVFSDDMGYEFRALTAKGIIYNEPGMLLDYSDGHWPITGKNNKDRKAQFEEMLEYFDQDITGWEDHSDDELQQIYDELIEDAD